mmetsp:Transcript_9740/g.29317  ORF Transcript_9740/g.29317 Transcript_9740/m.29317 type:complete len:90 (-) Transcript_9740:224-493(-)
MLPRQELQHGHEEAAQPSALGHGLIDLHLPAVQHSRLPCAVPATGHLTQQDSTNLQIAARQPWPLVHTHAQDILQDRNYAPSTSKRKWQ